MLNRTRFALWTLGLSALAIGGLLFAGPTLAHHGWGSYDTSKPLNLTGPVETLQWANPHALITIRHDGEVWTVVLAPISRMAARGLTQEMLKAGARVTVHGYPSTRAAQEMRAERITVGEQTFELR